MKYINNLKNGDSVKIKSQYDFNRIIDAAIKGEISIYGGTMDRRKNKGWNDFSVIKWTGEYLVGNDDIATLSVEEFLEKMGAKAEEYEIY